ncbi:hypothetical protein EVA_03395 [gut metagenome]|uniref:Uncharacterized protein n=1 Tax=gut metagenome TaxID=749906 RepID=J9D6V9_9ZZZZ
MHNLLPQGCGIDFLANKRILSIDRILLNIGFALSSTTHELVIKLHTDISTRHLAFHHLGINKRL